MRTDIGEPRILVALYPSDQVPQAAKKVQQNGRGVENCDEEEIGRRNPPGE